MAQFVWVQILDAIAKCYTETLGFTEAPSYACRMTDALLQTLRQNT